MRTRIPIVVSVVVAILAVSPGVQAGSSCTYDPNIDQVTALPGGSSTTRLFVDSGGEIKVKFEGTEYDCGDATTTNTTGILLDGHPGDESLSVSQNGPGGPFPPTISFEIQAEGGRNFFRLIGSSGPDFFRFGVDGLGGLIADLYASGEHGIRLFDVESVSARMLGGGDTVTGRPADFPGPLPVALDAEGHGGPDTVIGGTAGDEPLSGGSGDDTVKGLAGRDFLFGDSGDDNLGGGPGTDTCSGGRGVDRLRGCESES